MLRRAAVTAFLVVLMPATVHAFDHHHRHHSSEGGSGGGCGSSSSSEHDSPSPSVDPKGGPAHARVFVTSTTYSGALGSVTAADAHCQDAANARGLPGVFQAWISDGKTGAYDRTVDVGPWYTMADNVAFAAKTDLRGAPRSELLDEHGGYPEGQGGLGAWSGSDRAGVATGQDCDGWTNATAAATGTTGTALGSDAAWGGGNAPLHCDAKAPLICFEQ